MYVEIWFMVVLMPIANRRLTSPIFFLAELRHLAEVETYVLAYPHSPVHRTDAPAVRRRLLFCLCYSEEGTRVPSFANAAPQSTPEPCVTRFLHLCIS
jgi:hypothetical protein